MDIWDVILPIDELIFFRGVGIPPTRFHVSTTSLYLALQKCFDNAVVFFILDHPMFVTRSLDTKNLGRKADCPTPLRPIPSCHSCVVRICHAPLGCAVFFEFN